jgi:hypothetical protein
MGRINFIKKGLCTKFKIISADIFAKGKNNCQNSPSLLPKEFLQLSHRQIIEHPTPLLIEIKLNKLKHKKGSI